MLQDTLPQFHREISLMRPDAILQRCYGETVVGAAELSQAMNTLLERAQELEFYGEGATEKLAATLLCFELAGTGDVECQEVFQALALFVAQSNDIDELMVDLIGDHPKLRSIWAKCKKEIDALDMRFEAGGFDALPVAHAPTELKGDREVGMLTAQFHRSVLRFFGEAFSGNHRYFEGGFRTRDGADVRRIEAFLRELDSFSGAVPRARAYRAWVMLFYGLNMRSRSIFGAANDYKEQLLSEGLAEFRASGPAFWEAARIFQTEDTSPAIWQKVADLLTDHAAWLLEHPECKPHEYEPISQLEALYEGRSTGERRRGERD